ncbi:hypothetical protein TrCOL_g13602 [Triparma columacea]|uniref:DNA damage-binding protein 1 n=1 Tax=Triparma columacea TaxID=722753 RepID=A0A9W7LD17_9STRA|nr:hypothetical protein TrCOL_g13602 [Triparma columacea]
MESSSYGSSYVSTLQNPTVVTHAITCSLEDGTSTEPAVHLLLCKSNVVSVHSLTPTGIQSCTEYTINGRVSTLTAIKGSKSTGGERILGTTERGRYFILDHKALPPSPDSPGGGGVTYEVETLCSGSLKDPIGSDTANGHIVRTNDCLPTPLAVFHIYSGYLKVYQIDSSGALNPSTCYNARLEEPDGVIDICFLHSSSPSAPPSIAVLYKDHRDRHYLKTYTISLSEKTLKQGPWDKYLVESGATHLISSPNMAQGGVLIVGRKSITYHNGRTTKAVPMQTTTMLTWGTVGDEGNRFLLGDEMGGLWVVVVSVVNDVVSGIHVENLGDTCVPNKVAYLDNGVAFVAGAYGDSMLVKLGEERDQTTGSYLSPLEEYTSIGPVVDFALVDLDRRGQRQVVTASGSGKDGSLRVVRNGVGIVEEAEVEMPGIKGMWNLRKDFESPYDNYLLQSYISETRVLEITEDEMEEASIPGFDSSTPTLFACTTSSNHMMQITETKVNLVSCSTAERVDEYTAKAKITVASGNASGQILLAMGGGSVQYLKVDGGKIVEVSSATLPQEVSCIDLTPIDGDDEDQPSDAMTDSPSSKRAASPAKIAVAGLWNDNTVRVLSLESANLAVRLTVNLGGDTQARSVMTARMEGKTMLLIGLGDGQLITHELLLPDNADDPVTTANRKKVSLGTQPIGLATFSSGNRATCVFASSDRPTVVYSSSKKISFSNVNFPGEVNYVCPFNCELFPDCLALATENSLTIGTIDDIQKLHIQTFKLGEGPLKIAHHPETRTFAVCVEGKDAMTKEGEDLDTGYSVAFLDDSTFDEFYRHKLEPFEVTLSLGVVKLRNQELVNLDAGDEDDMVEEGSGVGTYIAVGTAVAHPDEDEATEGRILIFKVVKNENKTVVSLVTEKPTRGGVYSLCNVHEKLVAGINSRITLFQFRNVHGVSELSHEATHHGHILACYMKASGDFAVVGDLMRSISVMRFSKEGGAEKIVEVARDYNANWMTDVAVLDEQLYLGSEMSSNLFTLKSNEKSHIPEERTRLQVWGEYHLGQMVNKLERGKLGGGGEAEEGGEGGGGGKDVLFGTVDGAIGCVHQLDSLDSAFFASLQEAIAQKVKPVGGCPWAEWRGWCSERRTNKSKRFIDGDLCESFLDMTEEQQEEVVKEMNVDGGWDVGGKENVKIYKEIGAFEDEGGRISLTKEVVESKVEGIMRLIM